MLNRMFNSLNTKNFLLLQSSNNSIRTAQSDISISINKNLRQQQNDNQLNLSFTFSIREYIGSPSVIRK